MIIPNRNSWVILGPGRTGSMLLETLIGNSLGMSSSKWSRQHSFDVLRTVNQFEIWHYHNEQILEYVTPRTQVVVSSRNIFDSVISTHKQTITGLWHLTSDQLPSKYTPMYLDPAIMLTELQSRIDWYSRLKLTDRCVILDYAEFENNYLNVFEKLRLPIPRKPVKTIKIPGSGRQWVSNWDEIIDCVKDIECNPLAYLSNKLN